MFTLLKSLSAEASIFFTHLNQYLTNFCTCMSMFCFCFFNYYYYSAVLDKLNETKR